MPSTLAKPQPELTDLSLLALADIATAKSGRRLAKRFVTLFAGNNNAAGAAAKGFVGPHLQALVDAGLIEARRSTHDKARDAEPGWTAEITDNGRLLHRCLMAALRNAHA